MLSHNLTMALKTFQLTPIERISDQIIGTPRMDTDSVPLMAYNFQRKTRSPLRIIRLRQIDLVSGLPAIRHGPSIRAMSRDNLTPLQLNIGQKPLITPQQGSNLPAACK